MYSVWNVTKGTISAVCETRGEADRWCNWLNAIESWHKFEVF